MRPSLDEDNAETFTGAGAGWLTTEQAEHVCHVEQPLELCVIDGTRELHAVAETTSLGFSLQFAAELAFTDHDPACLGNVRAETLHRGQCHIVALVRLAEPGDGDDCGRARSAGQRRSCGSGQGDTWVNDPYLRRVR